MARSKKQQTTGSTRKKVHVETEGENMSERETQKIHRMIKEINEDEEPGVIYVAKFSEVEGGQSADAIAYINGVDKRLVVAAFIEATDVEEEHVLFALSLIRTLNQQEND